MLCVSTEDHFQPLCLLQKFSHCTRGGADVTFGLALGLEVRGREGRGERRVGKGRRGERRRAGQEGEEREGARRGGEERGKKGRRGGAREVYVVCINYLLRPTEPTCVCEADTKLGSADHTAMVYLQCVVCVCVCHRSQFKLGCLCVYCMCVCVCHRSPLQVGAFVCVLCYVCAAQIAAL